MKNTSLNILYEDNYIIVCIKPCGVPTQSRKTTIPTMESLVKTYLYNHSPEKGEPYLAVIHRLDQPVVGILLFAKTPFAARELNKQLQQQGFGKYYRALVNNTPPKEEDTLENYMIKNGKTNTSAICTSNTPGAKLARVHYKIVKEGQGNSNWGRRFFENPPSPPSSFPVELEIHLDTGRHHQIRVQLAHIGCPIIGDTKYNPQSRQSDNWQQICLCAYKLTFHHPKTNKLLQLSLL